MKNPLIKHNKKYTQYVYGVYSTPRKCRFFASNALAYIPYLENA
jgi:hypothetical protein